MDVAHGPSSFQTSPPPPRPAIPPKPDKEKIGLSGGGIGGGQKSSAGTQANFRRASAADAATSTNLIAQPNSPAFNFRSPSVDTGTTPEPRSCSSVLTPPPPVPAHQVPISPGGGGVRSKPALPPKPTNPALLSSPPITKFPGSKPSPLKFPTSSSQSPPPPLPRSPVGIVDNSNSVNNNTAHVNSAPSPAPPLSPSAIKTQSENDQQNNGVLRSPPPFLRAKPSSPPATGGGDPLSPRVPARSPNSRPNSTTFFNFSSPIQNLNSVNFPSTSGGLNQVGGGGGTNINANARFTSPQKIGEIRAKSASLGRNITFPFSSSNTSSSSGIAGLISRKSATLSKFLPLDLQIGSQRASAPPSAAAMNVNASKPPKPNSLNLNPFIVQQRQQQSQGPTMMAQNIRGPGQAPSVLNFGKSIAFSPDSPLPPPPPPRLKKKLSPVNSIGSPTSPTSPSPKLNPFLQAPTGPLPPPPPVSPLTAFQESEENKYGGEAAIYAEIDKQKKWAERKLKFEQIQQINQTSSRSSQEFNHTQSFNTSHDYSELNGTLENPSEDKSSQGSEETSSSGSSAEQKSPESPEAVNSWLGKYIKENKPAAAEIDTNPFRTATPTYQSANTGHIYETIGDFPSGAIENNNNNNVIRNNNNEVSTNKNIENGEEGSKGIVEVQETAEMIADELNENQSFLFKLVINHKKAAEAKLETAPIVGDSQPKNENEEENEAAGFVSADEDIPNDANGQDEKDGNGREDVTKSAINPYLIPTVIQEISPSPQLNELENQDKFKEERSDDPPDLIKSKDDMITTPSRSSSILRRRSWNCDRVGSPSPSESSSTTTSSSISNSIAYHRRDRSYTGLSDKSNRDSLLRESDWQDEGDLSNGALADAESSDAPLRSSAEDIIYIKTRNKISSHNMSSPPTAPSSKNFASRRSRLVNSFFGSFGKGSSSSSAGGSAAKKHGGKKGKERSVSHIIVGANPIVSQLPRQISDSILPSTHVISSSVISNSTSFDSGIPSSRPSQSVQFSPDVAQTTIIYPEHYSSAEDGLGNETSTSAATTPGSQNLSGGGDNESVSSSESVTGSANGSVSGYEDILAELGPKEKKSFYVAREILTTERTFVDVLNLLTVDFPKTLSCASRFHGQPVIPKEDLETILGGLPNLKRVNEELLFDLEERVANWKEVPKIADILVRKGPFLKLYSTYIKDFQKNSMHLDTCCQKYPLFNAAIKDFEMSDRCQKLGLKHYMLKPVQRMPQYGLMLEEYLSSLEKESEDYEDAVKGITIVKDVAEHANEAIRLQVNAEKLLHLQNRLSGTIILKADRQLIKEGELMKVCRKELQPRFFALMNDCLLCLTYHAGAGAPKDLKLRYELPLAGMRVQLGQADDEKEFSVISVTRSFNLVAKSSRERDEWMKALNNAIRDNIKKRACSTPDHEIGFQLGKEAPVWVQDSRVTMCQLCTAEFTALFRRHHCRACGKVVCGNCSGNQAPLPYLQNAANRVCDLCFEHLLEEFDKQCGFGSNDSDKGRSVLREKFKKVTPNVSKRASKMKGGSVPARLAVHANSSGSRISGYLQWREKEKKSWKKRWFVLMDRVLYVYAASEDIVALKSVPLLGWKVEMGDKVDNGDNEENQAVFKLTHDGHYPILFQAESMTAAEKWMAAMSEAVIL